MPMIGQPTRPPVVPAARMKPLHWKRYITKPVDTPDTCVWKVVDEIEFDEDDFVERFSVAVRRTGGGDGDGDEDGKRAGGKKGIVRVIDSKRSNHVAIASRSLPPVDKLIEAMTMLDSSLLSKEQLVKLISILPTPEEASAIKEAAEVIDDPDADPEDVGKLDAPDRLLLRLSEVPSYRARCKVWYFTWTFREKLASEKPKLELVSRTMAQLKRSKGLPALLGLALAMGNYLNGGNNLRGRADGFNFDMITRLDDFKDNTAKQSLLGYIVAFAFKAEHHLGVGRVYENADVRAVLRLPAEIPLVKQAKAVDLAEVESNIQRLSNELETMHTSAMNVLRSAEKGDAFQEKIPPFFSRAKFLIEDVRDSFEAAHKLFLDTREYFRAADDLSLAMFAQAFCDVVVPIERYHKIEAKRLADANKAAGKRAAAAATGRAAGAGGGDAANRAKGPKRPAAKVGDMNKVIADLRAGNRDAKSIQQAMSVLGEFATDKRLSMCVA